jgi:hypothetical protein
MVPVEEVQGRISWAFERIGGWSEMRMWEVEEL